MSENELARATSPYLLQHKNNPVHWLEWGPEVLAAAQAADKPILLSVGYAACHWCHVMARESFEDAATAEVMNALFVNIKVDREERPDIDHLYMSALHALGEQGGWPLTMFLTPTGEPFWGGTYFPKDGRFGRPAFTTVLKSVAAVYRDQRERVDRNTEALMRAVSARQEAHRAEAPAPEVLDRAAQAVADATDRTHGGLNGAPKFPNPPLIEVLFRAGRRHRHGEYDALAVATLANICEGGIYDHLGGGFARYSTDARWLVPHFEKMLYDNAQLLELLAHAHHLTDSALFAARVRETVAWLDREMTAPDGAFYSSLDADSDHVEGRFYIWTQAEIEAALGADDAAFFGRIYDVTPVGNWHDEETGAPVTILNRLRAPDISGSDEQRLATMRARLLDIRSRRTRPGLDDKILCDWNALMITGLVRAGLLLDEPGWIDKGTRAFRHLVASGAAAGGAGRLVHSQRDGQAGANAFASDYAGMARAALVLHEAKPKSGFVDLAKGWLDHLQGHYAGTDGLLFMSAEGNSDVIARLAPLHDDATPNANALYADALLRAAALTGDDAYRVRADQVLAAAFGAVAAQPLGYGALLNALDRRFNETQVVLAGDDVNDLRAAALGTSYLDRIVVDARDLPSDSVVTAQTRVAGRGAAFLCRGETCSAPIRDSAELAGSL